jgi:hypothetical protein
MISDASAVIERVETAAGTGTNSPVPTEVDEAVEQLERPCHTPWLTELGSVKYLQLQRSGA